MAREKMRHVTIIGVGLLGGSLGLALKRRYRRIVVAGVGRRPESLRAAMKLGAIDSMHLDAAEPVGESDLVVLCTPVRAFEAHLRAIGPHLRRGALVTDVGSTKAHVVRLAEKILGRGGVFVGSHPMAGSEKKGAAHARADLFEGALCVVTPTGSTPGGLLRRAERLWRSLGMHTVRMTPARHDRVLARVSHLPHLLAALLMKLPARGELKVAASGFRDATRLAGGDVEMWRDILLTNSGAVLDAIDTFDEELMRLRDMVELGDAAGIERLLAAAKKRRDSTVGRVNGARR